MRGRIALVLAVAAAILMVRNLYQILLGIPDEVAQGAIYRLLYFHVPSWWTAFIGATVAGVYGVVYLIKRDLAYDSIAAATSEVALLFLLCGIVLGSIWGRIIWGIWWTWDPRLTSALVCVLLYAGYLALRQSIDEAHTRARVAAVFSLFALADVPIVWFSIRWWRTQHPQPMELQPEMWRLLMWNWLDYVLLGTALILLRIGQLRAQTTVAALRREFMMLEDSELTRSR